MKNNIKNVNAYKTIGEVTKELGLIDKKTGALQTHTIRYWETQFKQIKPLIRAGNRRYYSERNLKVIKSINFLLKKRGLTINGAKKVLDSSNRPTLDADINLGVYKQSSMPIKAIKDKVKKISTLIRELKKFK